MQIAIQKIDIHTGNDIIEGIALIYMGVCMVFDIRSREIPLLLIMFGITAAFGIDLWQIREGAVTAAEVGISLIPGVLFLLTGFFTGEKVGYGDGLLLIILGLLLGVYRCFLTLCIGLVFSAAVSLALLLLHKASRHSRIPFAPFLVLGMGVVILG
ncbi:MAG: hypothetical protein HDR27_10730 [Lachnospiraceae bacterium]|nr:hypothetical protein [Lachnospiraceae bacterium]